MTDVIKAHKKRLTVAESTRRAVRGGKERSADVTRIKKAIHGIMGRLEKRDLSELEIRSAVGEIPQTALSVALSEIREEEEEHRLGQESRESRKDYRAATFLDTIADALFAPKDAVIGIRPNIDGVVR